MLSILGRQKHQDHLLLTEPQGHCRAFGEEGGVCSLRVHPSLGGAGPVGFPRPALLQAGFFCERGEDNWERRAGTAWRVLLEHSVGGWWQGAGGGRSVQSQLFLSRLSLASVPSPADVMAA